MISSDAPTTRLSRAPVVQLFRDALQRRGVEDLPILATNRPGALQCAPCTDAAALALGLSIERLVPLPEERQAFAAYDHLGWRFARESDEEDDDEDEIVHPATPPEANAPDGIAFRLNGRFGLFRVTARANGGETRDPARDELVYYWVHETAPYDDDASCVAARDRRTFERLVAEAEMRHRIHERVRPGLVVIGDGCERRTTAESVAWSDVLLPATQRAEIEGTVREFFASRELYRRHRLAYRRGILLAGPPGNGKTTVLKAIRASSGVPVVVAVGASEAERGKLIARAFDRAAGLAPAVLCFEDLDALVEDGPALSLFLNLLDGLAPLDGVLVVATTNRPDRIDPAIAKRPSRFDRVFVIAAPDRELRRAYLGRALEGDAPPEAIDRLADETEGWSVAFLKELVVQARFAAVRRADTEIRDQDLDLALEHAQEHLRVATAGLEERGALGFTAA